MFDLAQMFTHVVGRVFASAGRGVERGAHRAEGGGCRDGPIALAEHVVIGKGVGARPSCDSLYAMQSVFERYGQFENHKHANLNFHDWVCPILT